MAKKKLAVRETGELLAATPQQQIEHLFYRREVLDKFLLGLIMCGVVVGMILATKDQLAEHHRHPTPAHHHTP